MDKFEIGLDANEDELKSKQTVLVTKMNNKQNSLGTFLCLYSIFITQSRFILNFMVSRK